MIKSTPEADKKFDKRFSDSDGVVYQNHHTLNEHISSLRKQDIMSLMEDVEEMYEMATTTRQFMQRSIKNETLDDVKALLEENIKLL